MPLEKISGVSIHLEEFGSGDPLVLVHGSWADHMDWAFTVPLFAQKLRVVTYDRRGHSQSERLETQGSVHEDVADLAAIIERTGAPAHIVGNSFGGSISLRLVSERPELVRTVSVHEPPLIGLLRDDPETRPIAEELDSGFGAIVSALEAGEMEEGARAFVGRILGPDAWDQFVPEPVKQTLINNAPTFLDESRDGDALSIDVAALAKVTGPIMLSLGSEGPPFMVPVLDKLEAVLPNATRKTFDGAGHLPHVSHPQEYVAAITDFIAASGA